MAGSQPPRPEVKVDTLEALRRAPLLKGFTDVGLKILAATMTRRSVGRGTYLFRSGEPAAALSIVVRGAVQLVAREGGAALGELGTGEALGGFALLGPQAEHLLSALAVNDVELLELSLTAFQRLQREKPQAALKLTLSLSADLVERLNDARVPLREFLLWQISKRQAEAQPR
jgi:CRP-like cAMP-binding protein